MSPSDDQDVFRALADPTRRALLDALFERDGQTSGELADRFPQLTRFAVAKHLGVLEQADLVVIGRSGRHTLHHLNPVPIGRIAARWISKYAERFVPALLDLDQSLLPPGQDSGEASGPPADPSRGSSRDPVRRHPADPPRSSS